MTLPISSTRSRMSSAARRRMRARAIAGIACHSGSAVEAASMAALTSSAVPFGTVPTTSPVAGFVTSNRSPPLASVHLPPISSCSSCTSTTVAMAQLPRSRSQTYSVLSAYPAERATGAASEAIAQGIAGDDVRPDRYAASPRRLRRRLARQWSLGNPADSRGFFVGPTREVDVVKVEAVVIRERVETVIDAVEDQAGHIGVTVIEAVGHGRQRGHHARVPGTNLRVAVPAEGSARLRRRGRQGGRRSARDLRRGAERQRVG